MEIDAFRASLGWGCEAPFQLAGKLLGEGEGVGPGQPEPHCRTPRAKGTDVDKKEKARKACCQPQGRGRECLEGRLPPESEWKEGLPLGLRVGSWSWFSASPAARGHLDGPSGV